MGTYEDRFRYPMGNGNRKTPSHTTPDNIAARDFGSHIAVSQVAQELPMEDYLEWRKGLFAPETDLERQERLQHEHERRFGGAGDPSSVLYAELWARIRLNLRENARKALP